MDTNQPTKILGEPLTMQQRPATKYVIPVWLRDEQIRQNLGRKVGRLEPHPVRSEPIAIVCYGPSLNDTWEKIREFKYVISMSGSHGFLIERGIVPTWHTAVDPQDATVKLIGTPHKDVEYLIASACHPKVFNLLEGFQVRLWNVFDTAEEGQRILPRGEWALTGGANVGLRSMAIARFFGFTNQHVFGMDGSEGKTGKHAGVHPQQAKTSHPVVYDGVTYYTTPSFLAVAMDVPHELDQMTDVTAKFYGDGLVQHLMRNYQRKPPAQNTLLGIMRPELISKEYAELNAQLHRENLAYGVGGGRLAPVILKIAAKIGTKSILDYGCGKGYLAKEIPFPIWEYDPAIPGKTETPRPADLVVCSDVLEHIEPEKLLYVLADLRRCVRNVGYFVIHLGAAKKCYADGRNTHLIQQTPAWWRTQLEQFFKIALFRERLNPQNGKDGAVRMVPNELHVVVGPGVITRSMCEVMQLPGEAKSEAPPSAPVLESRSVAPDEKLKVVIGGVRKDRIPALVAAWSVKKRATCPVEIIHTWDREDLPKRPCPTGFSFVRFQVPALCGYEGRGLYMDSDQIVFGDVRELLAIDMKGSKILRPPSQTAVLLIDCGAVKWDIENLLRALDAGETSYQKMMWDLWPLQPFWIGSLPAEWNSLDRRDERTKLLHYTKVKTQPWQYEGHPFGTDWLEMLIGAIGDGDVTAAMIDEDIEAGYVKRECVSEVLELVR